MKSILRGLFLIVMAMAATLFSAGRANAQQDHRMIRIAKIEVDPAQLDGYNPSHITILEIYADTAAYHSHIQTPHFKKYKATVQNMVKSLELEDVSVIGAAKKPGM